MESGIKLGSICNFYDVYYSYNPWHHLYVYKHVYI